MSDDVAGFTDEERALIRSSVRRLLADEWPPLRALEMSDDPQAIRGIWEKLGEMSVPDLGRDPALGGMREILLTFEELGRACCPAPLLGALVVNLLAAAGVDIQDDAEAGPGVSAPVAVGFGSFDGDRAAGSVSLGQGLIDGSLHFVEGAGEAARFIALLDDPGGVAIIGSGAGGIAIEPTPALSLPKLASLHFQDVPVRFVPAPADLLRDITQIARLACASRAVGSAQRGFELVVEHVSARKQFGQLIGQFQAVQHRLVDNLTRLDGARLTLEAAATAHDAQLAEWRTFADLALAHLSPGLRQLAIDMHQLMGAIGYAEEHELPRHFRQIHGNVTRFGGVARARAEIGAYLVRPSVQAA